MRIALVGPSPPPNGGMAMQTQQLLQLLQARGHQVTLISTNPAYRPAFIGRIPLLRALFRLVQYIFNLFSQLPRYEVVHTLSNSGWAWYLFSVPVIHIARLYRIPCLINYRGGLADEFLSTAAARVRFSLKRSSGLIVPSTFLEAVFNKYGIDAEVIPNIVNLELFKYRPYRSDKKSLHLIVTRNLEALYGNHYAIEALVLIIQQTPGARMTIAGDGPERGKLEKLACDLSVNQRIHFTGRLDRSQMVALYASADILINPTTADNMPNSLLEAMACGIPIVTTAVGGIPYMVTDRETALLINVGDARAIADAVLELLKDPLLASNLSQNGHQKVIQYRPDAVLPLWEKCYQQQLAQQQEVC
ncbi:MAG: glycosyltransferase involved in cell wall biosynthesis [Motiliproteus sp.]|jgi:glycosyltransferase involved in cell wall biosynthesis